MATPRCPILSTQPHPMLDAARQEVANIADTIVVKVGTRAITHPDGALDTHQIASIAGQLALLMQQGRRVVLVSSGAVGAGIGRLGLEHRPSFLAQLQATAAVGQGRLIECYNQALQKHGRCAAQVLLTADDLNDRRRYLNARNTLRALFDYGAVPIVNENDTVRVDELQLSVGDNDRLAAVVTNLLRAPLLVLLSDVDGLYDKSPDSPDAKVLPLVEQIDERLLSLASGGSRSGLQLSTGGMTSKLLAAQNATAAGENVIIANGRQPDVLLKILRGEAVGTLCIPSRAAVKSRKRWIGWTAQPLGEVSVDAGAERAITDSGGSLLAVGVTRVTGDFEKGDVVTLAGPSGEVFARGLTNFGVREIDLVKGKTADSFEGILGHCPYREVIHRDNLTLTRGNGS